ncbi:MAG: class I SAM-dependent methyltransferase [Candidatus Pacebacteria bacterium]|nr:class I SAM-dependent methyltransferase [Candidatus Paceibacterota bacterium]
MPQFNTWENEYKSSKLLVIKKAEPQNDTLRFFRYLKKYEKFKLEGLRVLDLGSGTGRNANYLAKLGNVVVGMEISHTAIDIAKKRAKEIGVEKNVTYQNRNIGSAYPFEDQYFDLILDVTSSNSLNNVERDVYIQEVYRTLKKGGYLFVRALCLDGDKNAKNLLKICPGPEYDTYVILELGLIERVFGEQDFRELYGRHFKIKKLLKKSGYAKMQGQNYKRNYWLAYMQKVD